MDLRLDGKVIFFGRVMTGYEAHTAFGVLTGIYRELFPEGDICPNALKTAIVDGSPGAETELCRWYGSPITLAPRLTVCLARRP